MVNRLVIVTWITGETESPTSHPIAAPLAATHSPALKGTSLLLTGVYRDLDWALRDTHGYTPKSFALNAVLSLGILDRAKATSVGIP
jgi:hypothetical protein